MRRIGLAVVLALGLALAPLVVEAQEISKSARVGVLSPGISPAQVRESPTRLPRLPGWRSTTRSVPRARRLSSTYPFTAPVKAVT